MGGTIENPVIEGIIERLERAVEGDKRAIEELKDILAFVKEIFPILEVFEDIEEPEDVKGALQRLADDYEKILLEVFRAVG